MMTMTRGYVYVALHSLSDLRLSLSVALLTFVAQPSLRRRV